LRLVLTPAPGKASLDLLKIAREGLLVPLRAALVNAKREEAIVREEGLRVKSNGGYRSVNLEVIPVRRDGKRQVGFLVLFEAQGARELAMDSAPAAATPGLPDELPDEQVQRLTQELAATCEYVQSVIEQQEAANEELQSANEEVQSANEELQSINEELETSKEEIQSSNEELATVNDELQHRNLELVQANNDLVNLFSSVQMPIVMLGSDLRIRPITPPAEKLLNLIRGDVGRSINDVKLNLNVPDLEALLQQVIETVSPIEREVKNRHGRWQLLRIRPYRTLESKIDGAVLVLIDVDELKRAYEFIESVVAHLPVPLLVLDAGLRVQVANESFYQTFQVSKEETERRLIYEPGN